MKSEKRKIKIKNHAQTITNRLRAGACQNLSFFIFNFSF